MAENRSMQISGGDNSGQFNTGDHATLNQAQAADALLKALDRIAELLESHRAQVAEYEQAVRDLQDVREGTAASDPDRRNTALAGLSRRVEGVVPLLAALESIRNLLP